MALGDYTVVPAAWRWLSLLDLARLGWAGEIRKQGYGTELVLRPGLLFDACHARLGRVENRRSTPSKSGQPCQ
jgi:hypothetical protein